MLFRSQILASGLQLDPYQTAYASSSYGYSPSPAYAYAPSQQQRDLAYAWPADVPFEIPWDRIMTDLPDPTTADRLAQTHSFVVPVPWDGIPGPLANYMADPESALTIHFNTGRRDIVPDFRKNGEALDQLISIIERLLLAHDCKIERIVLAGFASPEGSLSFNMRLAANRSVALKEYLLKKTELADSQIQVANGSVDWAGLRTLVEQGNMRDKAEVLAVINNPPPGEDNRLARLQQLNGGAPYRHLLNYYFPSLRSGTLIRLYYQNK